MEFSDNFLNTGAGRLHYLHHEGTGTRMVLVGDYWAHFAGFLPEEFDLYLLDLLGSGESEKPRVPYTAKLHAEGLSEFMRELEIERSVLLGHSYSGWIAARYSIGNKDLIGLILEAPSGLKKGIDDMRANGALDRQKRSYLSALLKGNEGKGYVSRSIVDSEEKYTLTGEELSRILAPTLIIWGSRDSSIWPGYAQVFKDGIKHSSLEMIDAGHSVHVEKPVMVADLINNFIWKLPIS